MSPTELDDILNKFESKESIDYDIDQSDFSEQAKLHRERFRTDTKRREYLAKWTMWCVSLWLGLVIFVVIFNRLFYFGLSDSVLIALLGTTTLNVIGLAALLLKGYFNSIKSN